LAHIVSIRVSIPAVSILPMEQDSQEIFKLKKTNSKITGKETYVLLTLWKTIAISCATHKNAMDPRIIQNHV